MVEGSASGEAPLVSKSLAVVVNNGNSKRESLCTHYKIDSVWKIRYPDDLFSFPH